MRRRRNGAGVSAVPEHAEPPTFPTCFIAPAAASEEAPASGCGDIAGFLAQFQYR
ncbi:hypothetical protein [Aminobacter sp. HY435]|uniref:hypothetical protein n=1 Tax=Aminobacter sp. HY435 TaxID=2970917 RepID=UPI0022B9D43C|nr:hypothetical protein [Aminobacter sp. HY435]